MATTRITYRAGSRTQALPEPVPTARMDSPPFITKSAQEPTSFTRVGSEADLVWETLP
jgi:hypothetical protein